MRWLLLCGGVAERLPVHRAGLVRVLLSAAAAEC